MYYTHDNRISKWPIEETYGHTSGQPEATHRDETTGHFVTWNLDKASCSENQGGMWLYLYKKRVKEAMVFQQDGRQPYW